VSILLKNHTGIKAIVHVTGGGLVENIARVLPQPLVPYPIVLESMPPIFQWLAHEGGLSYDTMIRTFNCGIGMVLVAAPETVSSLCQHALHLGEPLIDLGPLHSI
jgi:phosphoribosylformylglycinamidine cyclo-ligase